MVSMALYYFLITGIQTYSLNSTNSNSAWFSSNSIAAASWSILENAGAVFLPAAGYRYGTNVKYVGSEGYYLSTSYSDRFDARYVWFKSGNLNLGQWYRDYGRSVRLVCDVEK